MIEYSGKTVFFAGDTGYDLEQFKEIGRKFSIDVALIPIAPIEPHDFMKQYMPTRKKPFKFLMTFMQKQ